MGLLTICSIDVSKAEIFGVSSIGVEGGGIKTVSAPGGGCGSGGGGGQCSRISRWYP